MSKELEKLHKQKKNLEEKIAKISGIANAREYKFQEIYDHNMIPYLATRAAIYGAGETFNDVYDSLEGNIASHSKVGNAIATGVNYAIAGATATVVALGAVPLAALETVYSVPLAAYQFVSERSKEIYNNRIGKASHKLRELNDQLEKVNAQIENESQAMAQ